MNYLLFLFLMVMTLPVVAQDLLPHSTIWQRLVQKKIDQAQLIHLNEAQLELQSLQVMAVAKNRQLIIDSLKREENNNLLKRIAALELRADLLETEQNEYDKLRSEIAKDKEQRKELNTTTIQSKYLEAMEFADYIQDESNDLAALLSWGDAYGAVETLGNPQKYPAFKSGLNFLKENQKSGFKLPEIGVLQSPLVNTVVSFISALGQKSVKAEASKGHLKKLQCLLDFTAKVEQNLDFVELENSYLKRMNSAIVSRSDTVRKNIFSLVGARTGPPRNFHHYVAQMDSKFIADNSATIEQNFLEIISAFEEYKAVVSFSIAALEKIELALTSVKTGCLEGSAKTDAENKINSLKYKVSDAKKRMTKSFYQDIGNTNLYGLLYGYTMPSPIMARK